MSILMILSVSCTGIGADPCEEESNCESQTREKMLRRVSDRQVWSCAGGWCWCCLGVLGAVVVVLEGEEMEVDESMEGWRSKDFLAGVLEAGGEGG